MTLLGRIAATALVMFALAVIFTPKDQDSRGYAVAAAFGVTAGAVMLGCLFTLIWTLP